MKPLLQLHSMGPLTKTTEHANENGHRERVKNDLADDQLMIPSEQRRASPFNLEDKPS